MENLEWYPFLYNGIETNIEITKCGKLRRIKKDWVNYYRASKYGEIDLNRFIYTEKKYISIGVKIKNLNQKCLPIHQIIASVFLGYNFKKLNNVVDHIDGNSHNNSLSNLQVISHRKNCSKEKTIKSRLPVGVSKQNKKYRSQISINNKQIYLGYFNTIEEASNAYQTKLKSLSNQ